MTLEDRLAAATALNDAAIGAGVDPNDARRLIERLVSLPDAGLAILASAKHEQLAATQRRAQRDEIRELAAMKRRAQR